MTGTKRKKNGWLRWVATLAILAVVAAAAYALGGLGAPRTDSTGTTGSAAAGQALSAAYATITRGSLTETVYGEGSLAPVEKREIFNRADGEVTAVGVEEGDIVQAGDVMMRMENSDLESEIAKLKTDLFSRQVELSEVRDEGSDTYIYAPSAGRLKVIEAEEDDDIAVVMKTKGRLAVISRDDKLKVVFEPEPDDALSVGDPVTVWIDSEGVDGVVDQVEGLAGKVSVTVEDDDYELGGAALVSTLQGKRLGEGVLEVNMPVPVTGIGGFVDEVYYDEDDSVGSGAKLFHVDGRIPSSELQLALLNYENTRTDLDNALEEQNKLIVRAPAAGIVTAVNAWEGQVLTAGTEAFSLQSADAFELKADVDELDIASVREGQRAVVTVDTYPGDSFEGTVSAISGVAEVSGGVATYEVTVTLDPSMTLRDGMTASMEIVTSEKKDILLAPSDAVFSEGGQTYVTTPDGRTVYVTTGIADEDDVEIVSGLEEGDRVMTRERAASDQSSLPLAGRVANRASAQANLP